ncbi:hypothetical protein Vafri_17794 [Volvox africanus]|uniref:EF-hand domain-containing protein n=1 Tax=Volvox africanus TaxID=51714 RepID=A0A8J4BLR8_9CHLO|nr:hypothetical protein Vafri_17794 [Volvox africanus]
MRRAAGYNSEDSRQWGPSLPNLPGVGAQGPMEPRPRGQTLRFVNGYRIAEDVQNLDPMNRMHKWNGRVQDMGPTPPFALHEAGQAQASQKEAGGHGDNWSSGGHTSQAARVPKWITYDRKVLGFGAYFQEDVQYSPLESWRVRKVTIKYYLENDQVEIVEARELNSGLSQGVLLRRHSAHKDDGSPLRWSDIRVGGQLTLYRRTYHLMSADPATRAFYSEQGQEQPADKPYPEGPYDQHRKRLESSRGPRPPTRGSARSPPRGPPLPADEESRSLPASPRGPGALFRLLHLMKLTPEDEACDGAVLRFVAAWDNTAELFGDVLPYAVFYYVSDGTFEVREVNRRNSGRDPFPLLLKRSRLPKVLPPVHGRPMSPETRRRLGIPYYDWRDLYLGATINVYGRKMMLYECDETTMTWLKKYVPGLTPEQLTPIQVDLDPFGPKRPPLSIPPNISGIGSEEDSLQNVLHLVPRPVVRPYGEYLLKGDKVFRFAAVMVPLGPGRPLVGPHDMERRFVLSFYLGDGTLSVFEPRQVNSGMEQGTFLERTRVPNPATGQPYGDTDMQVGTVLEVFGRGFQLQDADNFTLEYMEGQSYRFPCADYDQVRSKLANWLALYPDQLPDQLKSRLAAADSNGSGYVTKYSLYDILTSLGCDVTPHEVITLVRQLGADRQGLLAEQLLAALELSPPPEEAPPPHEPEPQARVEEPTQQPTPSVPFPAPGLRTGAWPPFRRVTWGPSPVTGTGPSHPANAASTTAGAAGPPYSRLGPTPGHPRVDMTPAQGPSSFNYHKLNVGTANHGRRSSTLSAVAGTDAADDDRQHPRDTPEKNWRASSKNGAAAPFGSSWTAPPASVDMTPVATPNTGGDGGGAGVKRPGGSSFLTAGIKQPASLWQTTNMAFGGVGHATSFQRR